MKSVQELRLGRFLNLGAVLLEASSALIRTRIVSSSHLLEVLFLKPTPIAFVLTYCLTSSAGEGRTIARKQAAQCYLSCCFSCMTTGGKERDAELKKQLSFYEVVVDFSRKKKNIYIYIFFIYSYLYATPYPATNREMKCMAVFAAPGTPDVFLKNHCLDQSVKSFTQGAHLSLEIISGINRERRKKANKQTPQHHHHPPTDHGEKHVVQQQGDEDDEQDELSGLPALPQPAQAELAPRHAAGHGGCGGLRPEPLPAPRRPARCPERRAAGGGGGGRGGGGGGCCRGRGGGGGRRRRRTKRTAGPSPAPAQAPSALQGEPKQVGGEQRQRSRLNPKGYPGRDGAAGTRIGDLQHLVLQSFLSPSWTAWVSLPTCTTICSHCSFLFNLC